MRTLIPSSRVLSLPSLRAAPVLPYQAETPVLAREDRDVLTWAAKCLYEEASAGAGTCEAFPLRILRTRLESSLLEPLYRAAASLQVEPETRPFDTLTLAGCQWRVPRAEPSLAGRLRAALVLRTGPSPYALSTLPEDRLESPREPLVVWSGDLVVYDPASAHSWHPARPHQDSFLALIQVDWPVADATDLAAIHGRYPALTREVDPPVRHLRLIP